MRLYSTIVDINEKMTKEDFIHGHRVELRESS